MYRQKKGASFCFAAVNYIDFKLGSFLILRELSYAFSQGFQKKLDEKLSSFALSLCFV